MNREVIAADQDSGGSQGYKLKRDGVTQVGIKPMSNGDRAVVLLSRGATTATVAAHSVAMYVVRKYPRTG